MNPWIMFIIEAIIPGIIVGVVMAYWNREQNKKIKAAEDKENNAKRKDALEISLLVATAELSYAIAMAIKRGTPNGEVEKAIERYDYAMKKFRDFEREQLGYLD